MSSDLDCPGREHRCQHKRAHDRRPLDEPLSDRQRGQIEHLSAFHPDYGGTGLVSPSELRGFE